MTEQKRETRVRMPREERRQQLLATALEVFAHNGYHRSSMDDIADAAHVSKPVLYQHFSGKRDLYLALIDYYLDDLTTRLVAALHSSEVNRERTEAMLGVYFDFVEHTPEAHQLIFESDLTSDVEVKHRYDDFHHRVSTAIADHLAPTAGLSPVAARHVARTLTGMAQTASVYWRQHPEDHYSRADAQRQLFRLAWGGISIIDEDWE